MEDNANLMAILRANPGIQLSDDDTKAALTGRLVQVGVGSIIPVGSLVTPTRGGVTPQRRGCIEFLQFFKNDEDLSYLVVDGNSYSGGNLSDFREVLLEAAMHMKCVSFCWYPEERRMTMLNVHPLCCCRCETHGND